MFCDILVVSEVCLYIFCRNLFFSVLSTKVGAWLSVLYMYDYCMVNSRVQKFRRLVSIFLKLVWRHLPLLQKEGSGGEIQIQYHFKRI